MKASGFFKYLSRIIFLIALGFACFQAFRSNLHKNSFSRFIVSRALDGPESIQMVAKQKALRDSLDKAAPEGNIFLRIEPSFPYDPMLEFYYYYGNYHLFPREILVSESPVVINNARDMRKYTSEPDDEALERLSARMVITFAISPEGEISAKVRTLGGSPP